MADVFVTNTDDDVNTEGCLRWAFSAVKNPPPKNIYITTNDEIVLASQLSLASQSSVNVYNTGTGFISGAAATAVSATAIQITACNSVSFECLRVFSTI